MRASFFEGDGAVNEVLGFILAFAISSLVLIVVMHAYSDTRSNADAMLADAEMKGIADRVSAKVVQLGIFSGDNNQNATFSLALRIPTDVNGMPYRVEVIEEITRDVGTPGSPQMQVVDTRDKCGVLAVPQSGDVATCKVRVKSEAVSGTQATSILNIANPKIKLQVEGATASSEGRVAISYERDARTGIGKITIGTG